MARFEYMTTGEYDVRCIGYQENENFTPFFTIGREYHVVDNVVIDDSGDERCGRYYNKLGSIIDHLGRYYIFEDISLARDPVEHYADILPNEFEEFFGGK